MFDRLYAEKSDPWNLASSPYEQEKYAATIAALGGRRFARGLEAGCSIGILTRRLARHCETLLAVDASEAPLILARQHCADLPAVRFERLRIPDQWPGGCCFDFVVFSEVLYFLNRADILRTVRRTLASLAPRGVVLLVNWTGPTNSPSTGDAAAEVFIAATERHLVPRLRRRGPLWRLDLLAQGGE
ncbi:MAG: class I SAM-dependent DNA methyltransferase [Acetobacteraceae bacterium]